MSCNDDGTEYITKSYTQADCQGNETITRNKTDTCEGTTRVVCPLSEPTPTKKPESQTDGFVTAIVVVVSISIVVLLGLAIYYGFRK